MKTPAPNDNESMRNALQRDAARVPQPPFDPTLHHAAMRRIRLLADPAAQAARFLPWAILTTATAVLTLSALALWWPHPTPSKKHHEETMSSPSVPLAPRTSQLAYQTAASQGDEVLFALLDRDARTLLPAASPLFNIPLH